MDDVKASTGRIRKHVYHCSSCTANEELYDAIYAAVSYDY